MLVSPDQNTTLENIVNMVVDFNKSSTLEYLFDWVQGETSNYPNLRLQHLGFLNWLSRHGVDVNCALYRHSAIGVERLDNQKTPWGENSNIHHGLGCSGPSVRCNKESSSPRINCKPRHGRRRSYQQCPAEEESDKKLSS